MSETSALNIFSNLDFLNIFHKDMKNKRVIGLSFHKFEGQKWHIDYDNAIQYNYYSELDIKIGHCDLKKKAKI